MKVALWQGRSPEGDSALAVAALETALAAAGAAGAAVLVAPEVWLPGYNQPDIPARALPPMRPPCARWPTPAARRAAALSSAMPSAMAIPSTIPRLPLARMARELANYRKVQLYGPRERSLYAPGPAM
jgi:5-aminopentanamidase